jgi:hypothetical protein
VVGQIGIERIRIGLIRIAIERTRQEGTADTKVKSKK